MLTAFDKALLNLLQTQLPISKRPFADLAEVLRTDEASVIRRIRELKSLGYIRRIGPFFDSANLGYTGTLVAVKVTPGCMESVAQAVNAYHGITHNYEREGEFNLWFTLLTPDIETQARILAKIGKLRGVEKLMNLSAKRKYKISVQFELK